MEICEKGEQTYCFIHGLFYCFKHGQFQLFTVYVDINSNTELTLKSQHVTCYPN